MTLDEMLAAFWRHAKTYYVNGHGQPSKEQVAYRYALRPLRKLYGASPVSQFGPLALKAVRQQMIELGWARTYINHQINRIRHVFKWATENELVPAGVFQRLQTVAGLRFGKSDAKESEPVRPVPDEHVDAIKPYVSRQVWAMVELQRLTGMRSGEVILMRGCDINTEKGVWSYTPARHKTQYRGH